MEPRHVITCIEAVQTFGKDSQKTKCIEEMGELIQALCKESFAETVEEKEQNLANIRTEIADVLITVTQMQTIYGEVAVNNEIDYKIKRLQGKIKDYRDNIKGEETP